MDSNQNSYIFFVYHIFGVLLNPFFHIFGYLIEVKNHIFEKINVILI